MGTFRYRLQALLDQKVERKQGAERHLTECRQKLREGETNLAECTARQREMEAERSERRRGVLAGEGGSSELGSLEVRRRVDDLALFARRIEDVKDEVMSLRLQIEECKERVEQAVSALANAAREVEVLNKHRAKGESRFRAELERKDAIAQDEIASALYTRRRL